MNTATTNTAYLIGLAKVLTCTTVHDPNGQTTDIVGRDPKDRPYDAWCRNVLIGIRSALGYLGLPGGFTITFDHKPPPNARPDLAILAACVLASGGSTHTPDRTLYLGSLSLNTNVQSTRGVLPILDSIEGFTHAFVPQANAEEAGANTNRVTCTTIANVHDLIDPSSATRKFAPATMDLWEPLHTNADPQGLSEEVYNKIVQAYYSSKPVLIVGANAWKAAKVFHTLVCMRPLSGSEARGVAAVHSVAGLLTDGRIPRTRPFRAPHHTVADSALVGGDFPVRPGEISLASWGTLVLDHVLDFKRTGLSYLQQIVKDKRVRIVRGGIPVEYPAHTRIVATVYPDELRFLTPERIAFLGDHVRVDVDS